MKFIYSNGLITSYNSKQNVLNVCIVDVDVLLQKKWHFIFYLGNYYINVNFDWTIILKILTI